MPEVRKAIAEDFEQILPLLLKLNADPKVWSELFINHWQHPEDYFGFVLTDEEKIIGFLGMIFSHRCIDGRPENFCNLSTWIVDDQYKKHGLSLFLPVLELENYTVTNFSSAGKTYIISKKLGFEDVEYKLQYIFPFPKLKFGSDLSIEFNATSIGETLSGDALQVFQDHVKFNCHHVLIKQGNQYCYLIVKKSPAWLKPVYYANRIFQKLLHSDYIQEHAFLGQIHYVSNKVLFRQVIGFCAWSIFRRLKVIGLLAPAHWLAGSKNVIRRPYQTYSTPLFKSNTVKKEEVDTLYSEIFVLDS